jgi:hypothetical protein
MPALPLDDAGPYVAGAYLVFVALILVYVVIMATKLARIERELVELSEIAEQRVAPAPESEREAARPGEALAGDRAPGARAVR